jgi:hypothetical protein
MMFNKSTGQFNRKMLCNSGVSNGVEGVLLDRQSLNDRFLRTAAP